jgi:hypothetical protein
MSAEVVGGIFGLVGGLLGGCIAAWAAIYINRRQNAGLESDEIRRRKIDIIFQLLGSRYVLVKEYKAGSSEVQVFNTAMALFSIYFSETDVRAAYDKFLTHKTDENLIDMLKVAAQRTGLDLLDSNVQRVMTVQPQIFPLVLPATYSGTNSSTNPSSR